ncbi:MAG: rhomboid family intramembrane serine protease [candidate division NC10 bacterium]|nr:rhomboid family intramembrane serine protease [candidate division NC10 bacterium]
MLIPIGHEHQQVTRLPWVTITLVAANVAAFLLTLPLVNQHAEEVRLRALQVVQFAREHPYLRLPKQFVRVIPARRPPPNLAPEVIAEEQVRLDSLMSQFQARASASVYRTYGYIPAEPRLLAMFTSMFMHGGWLHLIGNMLFLWLAGGSLEDRWGRVFFPVLYVVSGVAGTLTHAAMHAQSTMPLVGASGAIAGLMGAFLVRQATTRIRFFYWIYFFRGTFHAPAYVALPLWLLQQFAMARSGQAGGVAVWAHIGGFGFGALVAIVILMTGLEAKVLAPAIQKKTTWTASDRLAAALGKLDRGDTEGAIKDLEALLKAKPDNIDARTSLIDAHARRGDQAAAGRESARLVGAYFKARDMTGAMAAAREHKQTYRDVPLALRDQLALASDCEKRQEFAEAAERYREALASWPDDPLAPKALMAYGRLLLQVFKEPGEALALLEQARIHPRATPEFQQASLAMIAMAKDALQPAPDRSEAAPQISSAPVVAEAPPPPPPPETRMPEPVPAEVPAPPSHGRLLPVPMRAVGLDARGLQLQDQQGRTGLLPWKHVAGISVVTIGNSDGSAQAADSLILDLLMGPNSTPARPGVRCVRLSVKDLTIPQLQGESSPVRAFQRFVATILKVTGATPHPSRDACLGLHGFPSFPDLATYEADLVATLPTPGKDRPAQSG